MYSIIEPRETHERTTTKVRIKGVLKYGGVTERVKMVRKKFHMNRTELVRSIGIKSPLVSQMELGQVNVSWKTNSVSVRNGCAMKKGKAL